MKKGKRERERKICKEKGRKRKGKKKGRKKIEKEDRERMGKA